MIRPALFAAALFPVAPLAALPASAASQNASCDRPANDALATLLPQITNVGATGDPRPAPPAIQQLLGGTAEYMGHGASAMTWCNADWCAKVYMKNWGGDPARPMDPEERASFVDKALWAHDLLTTAPSFARFARLIPETYSPGPLVIVQRRAKGERRGRLSAEAQAVAQNQRAMVLSAVGGILPWQTIDIHDGNVDFGPRGGMWDWFDWLKGIRVQAREKISAYLTEGGFTAQGKDRPIGPSYGVPLEGGWWVVYNPHLDRAFAVGPNIFQVYRGTEDPRSGGRPMWSVLGLPLDEPHHEGQRWIQHFEKGYIIDTPKGVRAVLTGPGSGS